MNNIKNVPVRTGGCELCLFEGIEAYETDYLDKKRTVKELVASLKIENVDCTVYKFYNHIRSHLKPEVALLFSQNSELLATELIDKRGELIGALGLVGEKIEALNMSITSEAHPSLIKAWTGLITEARHTVEALQNIETIGKGSSQHVHINNLNVEYKNVVAQVLQDACQNCKKKFANTLAPLISKVEDGKVLS